MFDDARTGRRRVVVEETRADTAVSVHHLDHMQPPHDAQTLVVCAWQPVRIRLQFCWWVVGGGRIHDTEAS